MNDRKVPPTCSVLKKFSDDLSLDSIAKLLQQVNRSVLCPGNPEDKFVSIYKNKGGKVRGDRGRGSVVAYIDNTKVIDSQGKSYCCSVRRTDCDIICDIPVRCKPCNSFRDSLRKTSHRQLQNVCVDDHTSAMSHTCYCLLTSAEKDARLKNLHQSFSLSSQRNAALKVKINRLIQTQSLPLQENDASDITSVITDVTGLVEENFPTHTPQRIFWDQQMQYNRLKNKRQMRWHPFMIRFALNLKYLSTSAYRAARLSGVINLPSERTLADYTHWSSPHSGIQLEFVEEFKRFVHSRVMYTLWFMCMYTGY